LKDPPAGDAGIQRVSAPPTVRLTIVIGDGYAIGPYGVSMEGVARSVIRVGSAFRPASPVARFTRSEAGPSKNWVRFSLICSGITTGSPGGRA